MTEQRRKESPRKPNRLGFKHNCLNERKTKDVIRKTLKFVSDTVSSSLGPYGSSTIVQDTELQHYTTKDGYTILSRIGILNAAERSLLDMIRRISKNLVKEVGDGSTSCIVVANSLYNNLIKVKEKLSLPDPKLMSGLLLVKDILSQELLDAKRTVENLDEIKEIASISGNNDESIGEFVKEIYTAPDGISINKDLIFYIEQSPTEKRYFERASGYEHKRGYIDPIFIRDFKESYGKLEHPLVFMTNGTLGRSDVNVVVDIINTHITEPSQKGETVRPLIFMAKNFDNFMIELFRTNKLRFQTAFPVFPVDIATGTQKAMEKFNDLAVFLNATPLDKLENQSAESFDVIEHLGSCEAVHISEKSTKFIEGHLTTDAASKLLTELRERLSALETNDTKFDTTSDEIFLKSRIATLSNNMVKVYVGGSTEMEKRANVYLLDDALLAARTAIEHGYTIGCNLAVPYIIDNVLTMNLLQDKYGIHADNLTNCIEILLVVRESFLYAYSNILKNYFGYKNTDKINEILTKSTMPGNYKLYNLTTQKFESVDYTKIINPVKTEIEILNASFSIIGLLVNSNQFISLTMN